VVHRFELGVIPAELRDQCDHLAALSARLQSGLQGLAEWLEQGLEGLDEDLTKRDAETWYPLIGTLLARVGHMTALWQQFSAHDQQGSIPRARWLQFSESAQGIDVELSTSPIMAAQVLQQYLWQRCFAAIVTSATLMALERFDRFVMLSGVPEQSHFHALPSPFDYPQVASLCVPRMDFDPSDQLRHTRFVVEFLIHHGFEGAVLVLFTSRRQLAQVLDMLPDDLAQRVLAQGQLGRSEIIRQHKERIDGGYSSVIFGLASFAEGVDLPGDYCRHVVIAKLPFSVPEEPIDATLAEWVKQRGGNPFMEMAVPDAAIRLKQAVGRLIRTEQDSGRITILDRRLLKRHYGKAILRSLPPIPVVAE
jgi:ATP-dependent DNA helicase DinG